MRRRRTTVVGALCALTGALALTTSTAQAGDSYRDRAHQSDRYEHQRYDPSYAGTLIIDGCAVDLTSRRPLGGQIVAQIGRRGYRVWCEGGKVFIRWHGRRPRVQWRSGCYRVSIRYAGDCIILCPIETAGGRSGRVYYNNTRYDTRRDVRGDYRGGSYRSKYPTTRTSRRDGSNWRDEAGRYDRRTNMPYPPRSGDRAYPSSGWSITTRYRSPRRPYVRGYGSCDTRRWRD